MTTHKTKIRYRYRNRPQPIEVTGPVNVSAKISGAVSKIKDFQQVLITLGSVAAVSWLFLGPFVDAKAEELLVAKLVQIGMDPANIQQLNKSLEEIQKNSEERNKVVDELKGDINKIIIILEQQNKYQYPPVQMQASPPPIPVAPAQ